MLDVAFGDLEAVFELGDSLFEKQDARFELVGPARAGNFRVAELALECREEVERIAAAVGPGDLAFLLAEEGRKLGDELGVEPAALLDVTTRSERRSGRRNRRRLSRVRTVRM